MKNIYTYTLLITLAGPALAQHPARPVAYRPAAPAALAEPDRLPVGSLMDIGKAFIGKPYVANTLDEAEAESLVVNLDAFDCTTFVETVLAMALARQEAAARKTAWTDALFRSHLTRLRYRQGVIDGYASRLHYFSDWLRDNEQKGLIQDVTRELGGMTVSKPLNYMTTHLYKYPKLYDKAVYQQIAQIQQRISQQSFAFIPKKQLAQIEGQLREGDIVMLTAARPGLDMKHVGFATLRNGRVHLLHASSEYGEVMITEEPLTDYVLRNRWLSGIRVARLKTPGQAVVMR